MEEARIKAAPSALWLFRVCSLSIPSNQKVRAGSTAYLNEPATKCGLPIMRPMESEGLARFSGPPRSLVWRGGAVHLRRCADASDSPGLHAHFALQLSVSLTGETSLRCDRQDPERSAAGWLIRSDQPHWLNSSGTGITFFWDPVSPPGRLVATRLRDEDVAPLAPEECESIRLDMRDCWARGWRHADLRASADRIVHRVALHGAAPAPIDRRVLRVLNAIQSDPAGKSSFAEFARLARLSESRLAHLFRRDVGIPVRQYRLALRMEQAVQEIAAGASISWAACSAGFADPAPFCRICRRMFGSAPSKLPDFEWEV